MSQQLKTITADSVPRKVMYRLAGKHYWVADEQGPGNPFEETTILPGQTWTLPVGAKLLKVVELEGLGEVGKSGDD